MQIINNLTKKQELEDKRIQVQYPLLTAGGDNGIENQNFFCYYLDFSKWRLPNLLISQLKIKITDVSKQTGITNFITCLHQVEIKVFL